MCSTMAFGEHGADEFADVVDADEVFVEDVAGNAVVELEDTVRARAAYYFFVLEGGDGEVFDLIEFDEVVDILVVRKFFG